MNRWFKKNVGAEGAKVLANTGWLYLDQIVRLAVSLIVFSLVVRGLGAERYGVLSYAMVFPGIFMPLAMLGLDYVIVRDFVRYPAERERIFGTAFALKAAAATVAFLAAAAVAWWAPLGAPDKTLLLITSASLLIQPLVTIDYYFQSQVAAKYSSLARIFTALAANGVRAWLALSGAPVKWFVWLFTAEAFVYAVSLLAARRAAGLAWVHPWLSFDTGIMRRLLSQAWPLFLADIAMIGFLKFDQILLSGFAGLSELGKYAAAFRLADNAEFFALALINSYFPKIIQLHQDTPELLMENVRRFFARMTWFVVAVALVASLAAPLLSQWIFGSKFGQIWPVLVVLVWANVFVTQIAVRGKWFLAEGLQLYSLAFFTIGAAVHLSLLPVLSTRWGALGAAVSFYVAQVTMAVVAPVLFPRTRAASVLALRSFLPRRN
jgi:O-antigen/teichoic acid export membrane protein